MNLTKIEWVKNQDGTQGYTCNPVKGYCPVGCSYCYARAMYDRFGWDKTIRYDSSAWFKGVDIWGVKKPSKIFVGSTIELFGEWVKDEWLKHILNFAKAFPEHTFIFLTKRPWELPKWNPWPDNAWVGATATTGMAADASIMFLVETNAKVKFLSMEPLLDGSVIPSFNAIHWLVIGAQTNPYRPPKLEEVEEIIKAADRVGIPVFLKDNLNWPYKRQEFPGVMDE